MVDFKHTSVLLKEAIESLNIKNGAKYIDATLGGGGHAREVMKKGGMVLGIDQDKEALEFVQENFKFEILNLKLKLVEGNFKDIKRIAEENGFEHVAGVLFDLGVSSYQIDESGRGFSFRKDEPLDMRMFLADEGSLTAEEIVNTYSEDELYNIFSKFGEEPYSKVIAHEIVEERRKKRIERVNELTEVIKKVRPSFGKLHPATLVFQALRIAVNNELENLSIGLHDSFQLLQPSGRLVVISFHSLEDRIVKNFFRNCEGKKTGRVLTKKPIIPSQDEIDRNRRARSAKMRIIEKLA